MSVDKAIREMIRDEVDAAIAPLAGIVAQIQAQGGVLAQLSAVLSGGRRGPGRPPNPFKLARAAGRAPGRVRTRAPAGQNERGCALAGCKRPSRSKGYCAAHYQKYRNLDRTGRLPAEWKEFAPPNSVKDVVLARGRAGARALAELGKRR